MLQQRQQQQQQQQQQRSPATVGRSTGAPAGSVVLTIQPQQTQLEQALPIEPEKWYQQQQQEQLQQQLHSQQRSQRIKQQLANYRPRRRRSKREPPMVPGPSFAAAVGLGVSVILLAAGGGACFALKCNGDTGVGLALLILACMLLIASTALFASLPCCYCDESRNCRVRDACALRWANMRRPNAPHPAAVAPCPTGQLGLPAITVRDYSSMDSPSTNSAGGGTPRTASSTVSIDDRTDSSSFAGGIVGGRRNSLPPQLAWCYEGEPPDPSRLHPMYSRRRDSWGGGDGVTIQTADRMPLSSDSKGRQSKSKNKLKQRNS